MAEVDEAPEQRLGLLGRRTDDLEQHAGVEADHAAALARSRLSLL